MQAILLANRITLIYETLPAILHQFPASKAVLIQQMQFFHKN